MLKRLFHLNLNVRDMASSLLFYQALGFELVDSMDIEAEGLGVPLGFSARALRTAFLRLPGNEDGPMLDLVQFLDPLPEGIPYEQLHNAGIGRIAFSVPDVDQAFERITALHVVIPGPVTAMLGPGGKPMRTFCFQDPDRIYLQIFGSDLEQEVSV